MYNLVNRKSYNLKKSTEVGIDNFRGLDKLSTRVNFFTRKFR